MIELRTLGTLDLRDPSGEDIHSVLAQPKRIALLAYLAIARPRGFHRRDTLLALLWPEQDEQHARWALNQALRHLRQALGKEVLPSRGDGEVGIAPQALSCDAVEFEAALETDNPARGLELYRGDLLEGFHVSGCGAFERWLEEERVWLRRRASRAAATLARREEARGEPVAAGHWARRAFALCPEDEGEARALIELLGRLGDRAGAVQIYEELARHLREEYETEPAPETRAAITAVRARQADAPVPAAERADPLRGKDDPVAPEPAVVAAPPLARRRRWRLLALGFPALIAATTMVWWLRQTPAASHRSPLPPTTIAVLPFTYRGSPDFGYLSEGMVDLLSANLNGAGEIRTVDPYAVLARIRQNGRFPLDRPDARRLAGRLGAGAYIQGNVVEAGGRLRISASLQADEPGTERLQAMVGGPSDLLFQLVDELTAQLIAHRSDGPTARLSRLAALTTDSLAALKAYLEGERHFRAGQLDSSLEAVGRAVRIDSGFALAHYRMATVEMWRHAGAAAEGAVDRALRHSHRLGDNDRRFIQAFAATLHGRLAEAERLYREILSRDPDHLEATLQLAELVFHRDRDRGRYSWLDAREGFERVLAIDPDHDGSLFHLTHIAARERRLEELDSLSARLLRKSPELTWFFDGQRAVLSGDAAGVDRLVSVVRKGGDGIQPEAGFLVFTTGDLRVGRTVWRVFTEPSHSRGTRVLAHLTLAKIEVMSGRWRAAEVELRAAAALDSATALEHRVLLSLWPLMRVPGSELEALRSSLLRRRAGPGPSDESSVSAEHAPAHPYLSRYLLGLLGVTLGDRAGALAQAADLKRRADASFAPHFVRDLGRGLRAEVARAQGRPAQALTILDSLEFWAEGKFTATGNSPFFVHEREQFLRAELLGALGRHDEAIQAYRALADALFHSGAPAHFRLAEIYQRRGERQKAADHYARFIELWRDCDPELRRPLEEARRRMARLRTVGPTPSDSRHTPPPQKGRATDVTLGSRETR